MIDWLLLLKFSVRELGISPTEFWQMTLKEFIAIAATQNVVDDISKIDIKDLMGKFPDKIRSRK
jgi:uncharacterized phage protein (TIGR02216 family)